MFLWLLWRWVDWALLTWNQKRIVQNWGIYALNSCDLWHVVQSINQCSASVTGPLLFYFHLESLLNWKMYVFRSWLNFIFCPSLREKLLTIPHGWTQLNLFLVGSNLCTKLQKKNVSNWTCWDVDVVYIYGSFELWLGKISPFTQNHLQWWVRKQMGFINF
jgi:hypothetical protein